ncbi:PREDICTED: somatomedin-B and thrombospondin type-1 domain-containing protein-like [Nanorana parkeri]|uniref:somatomedin-B and thrombospondin type-1 domain-containing protein-like n=1 Tax=Nanorana parkeri TaxID=125878 RepID=UPI0008549D58|nr:PREDICTED: somatomedin-B and thrombospondin type-1 domain-containing protein-like [Nanorana parkeri]
MQLRSSGIWLILCSMWALQVPGGRGICARRGHPRCCPGRNNACTGVSPTGTMCYCDTYCQRSADCCEDYGVQCGGSVSHCVVGPWGIWSECSSRCGIGSRERARQVTVPPRSGGSPCPDLRQRQGCYGDDPTCHSSKEVARILPGSFKRLSKDPWRKPYTMTPDRHPSYCVYFRLKHVGPGCRLQSWSRQLEQEQMVCVECQAEATTASGRCQGDGVAGARTFWTVALLPRCQGSWIQEDLREDCMCHSFSFLFV